MDPLGKMGRRRHAYWAQHDMQDSLPATRPQPHRDGATYTTPPQCRRSFVRQKSRPPAISTGVGQTNRKSMAIEARQRQCRRRFTARGLFTARAVPCGHRSIQGFKQQEQQADSHTVALDTGARMTHEARRRRRPWRSATPNVGAWMPDETRHRRRPWSTAALNIGAWMTQEHTKKRRGRQRHPSMLETGRQPHCRLAASL